MACRVTVSWWCTTFAWCEPWRRCRFTWTRSSYVSFLPTRHGWRSSHRRVSVGERGLVFMLFDCAVNIWTWAPPPFSFRSVPVLRAHRPRQHGGYLSRQHSGPVAHELRRVRQQTSFGLRGFWRMRSSLVGRPRGFVQRLFPWDGVCGALSRGHAASAGLEPRPAAALAHPHAADQHGATVVRLACWTGHAQPQVTWQQQVWQRYTKESQKNLKIQQFVYVNSAGPSIRNILGFFCIVITPTALIKSIK